MGGLLAHWRDVEKNARSNTGKHWTVTDHYLLSPKKYLNGNAIIIIDVPRDASPWRLIRHPIVHKSRSRQLNVDSIANSDVRLGYFFRDQPMKDHLDLSIRAAKAKVRLREQETERTG